MKTIVVIDLGALGLHFAEDAVLSIMQVGTLPKG